MVLRISNLHLSFVEKKKEKEILRGVDLEIPAGETLGLVGESGAGKSLLALSIMGLLPTNARIRTGRIEFMEEDILSDPKKQTELRGNKIGIIFQDPSASLDPLYRIGFQVTETLLSHNIIAETDLRKNTLNLLGQVELQDPAGIAARFPHQISGGEKQRVMIAISLAGNPSLLLADEPTASLDTATGQQILSLLSRLQEETGVSILFISHNLPLIEQLAKKIAVIYAGRILEKGPAAEVIRHPLHPYTRMLYSALPDPAKKGKPLATVSGYQRSDYPDVPGCVFFARCPEREPSCQHAEPPLTENDSGSGHWSACWKSSGKAQFCRKIKDEK